MTFPRRNKYNAKRTERDGRSFASGLEATLYGHLKLMEAAGDLSDIRQQPNLYLTAARILMIPDFSAVMKDGSMRYFEAKGVETDVWRIKRRLWLCYGEAPLEIWKGRRGGNLTLVETLFPKVAS